MSSAELDWAELAFGSKKPLRELKAIFIAAPRELSAKRFKELVKAYLPEGNIVLGLAKEPYIDGFEDQPQFRTLQIAEVQKIIKQVNAASPTRQIVTLCYLQRELPYILEKIPFKRVVVVNGSWKHVFHASPAYYTLMNNKTPYDMVSPFCGEAEARAYEAAADAQIVKRLDAMQLLNQHNFSETEMRDIAGKSATRSYDYSFQTGTALGRRLPSQRYRLLISTFNKVVPYQTYAMLHGSTREQHFSPPNDLNHYDTVHAEMWLLIEAQKAQREGQKLDMTGTTLFINLMPCPTCARILSQTDIAEFVYSVDHSEGYAVAMLEAAGKKVRRITT
nr:Cytidine and deoxycytidylate deaminase zinc-binding region [uncultured bacterium]AIA17553.1 Cytidine and deoxycytidylate deaminase zinc-binding region [uncultured bacterium]